MAKPWPVVPRPSNPLDTPSFPVGCTIEYEAAALAAHLDAAQEEIRRHRWIDAILPGAITDALVAIERARTQGVYDHSQMVRLTPLVEGLRNIRKGVE